MCRSTFDVFTRRLASDASSADASATSVPNTGRVLTPTTRLPSRPLYIVAYVNPYGTAT